MNNINSLSSLNNLPIITFTDLLRSNNNTIINNNNQLLEYYTYDLNNNNEVEVEKIDNDIIKYSISDKILNDINQETDLSNIKQLLENKIFNKISNKINVIMNKLFDINNSDLSTLIDTKKDNHNLTKFVNTLDLYKNIKNINDEYQECENNDENKLKNLINNVINNHKNNNNNIDNLNNIIDNYYNFINSKNIFNFDVKEHIKNQEYIMNITNKKIDEYNETILLLDNKINLYYKIHVETKNYISVLNNINNNNILSSSNILKEYINDLNNKIVNDDEIYKIIKKIINLKLEIDFFYILFCKNGSRNEDVTSCSICKMKKISCCAIPCGHTYCNVCVKISKKCSFCKQNINNIQKIYIL